MIFTCTMHLLPQLCCRGIVHSFILDRLALAGAAATERPADGWTTSRARSQLDDGDDEMNRMRERERKRGDFWMIVVVGDLGEP